MRASDVGFWSVAQRRNKGRHGYGSGTARIASGVWLVHNLRRRTCGLIVDGQWTRKPLGLRDWRSGGIHNDNDEATSKTWDKLPAKALRERWACRTVGRGSYLGCPSIVNGPSSWYFLTETFVRAILMEATLSAIAATGGEMRRRLTRHHGAGGDCGARGGLAVPMQAIEREALPTSRLLGSPCRCDATPVSALLGWRGRSTA